VLKRQAKQGAAGIQHDIGKLYDLKNNIGEPQTIDVVDSQDAHNSSQGRVVPAGRNIEQTIFLCHTHCPVFLADLLVNVSIENFNRI
jgi:hypothetical protein